MHTRFLSASIFTLLLVTGHHAFAAEPACPPDLTGTWSGKWESCTTGHCGPLHARFCQIDDCHYRVTFHGRFAKVIPFRYSVVLNIVETKPERVILAGESRLLFFGTFTYHAEATACEFTAHYDSCKDQGTFTLCRDVGKKCCP